MDERERQGQTTRSTREAVRGACTLRLHGAKELPEVTVEGDELHRLQRWLRVSQAQDGVEVPWNPMNSYAGVEVKNPFGTDPRSGGEAGYLVYQGRLVDRRRRQAWPCGGLEDWLLALLTKRGQEAEVKRRVGRLRWRRVRRHQGRQDEPGGLVTVEA